MPNVEPYLLWNGRELVNALRTLTYLRAGLAGPEWIVEVASPLVVSEGYGYRDLYRDIYGGDRYAVANLACYCALFDTGPFGRPDYDPAPWFDAARPESGDFLGIWPEVVMLNPALRAVTARSSGGGTVSPFNPGPRTLQVGGRMYATSKEGMDWGERWLTSVLSGTDSCDGDTLTLLPTCPPEEVADPESYLRQLAAVALLDGPTFSDIGVDRSVAQGIAFQLGAGEPWLRREVVVRAAAPMPAPGVSLAFEAPALVGDAAAVLTFTGPMTATVTAVGLVSTTFDIDLEAGQELVVDASRAEVRLDGSVGGLDVLSFVGLFDWIVAPAGSTATVIVHQHSGAGSLGAVNVLREL